MDPKDYAGFLDGLRANDGCTTLAQRFLLAKKVWGMTSDYDMAVRAFIDEINPEMIRRAYDDKIIQGGKGE